MKKNISYIVAIFFIMAACKPEAVNPKKEIRNSFVFVNNSHSINKVDFNIRIYYPIENITEFINKIKGYKDIALPDSLRITIDTLMYKNCEYQFMIYVFLEKEAHQYRSKTVTLGKKVDSVYYVHWPQDSVLFDRIR